MITPLKTDITIIGGGITGLFSLNRLKQLGFNVVLLEKNALGSKQTIHSQGIIHGGLKYALTGKLSPSSESIQQMPKLWADCLNGKSIVNLSNTTILAKQHYLWSTGKLKSNVMNFFASKMLSSRISALIPSLYPAALQSSKFKGQVYVLAETILNTQSLIKNLSQNHQENLCHVNSDVFLNLEKNKIKSINVTTQNNISLNIESQAYLFAAGEHNATLTKSILNTSNMQTRPLHMVYIKFLNDNHPTLFGHCMEGKENPRITITTHKTQDNKTLWYCGGQLAEKGVHKTQTEQIQFAKKECTILFPWLDFSNTQWGCLRINRTEPKQPYNKRPADAALQQVNNTYIAWPTKLVFAPVVAEQFLNLLKQNDIKPNIKTPPGIQFNPMFPVPPIAYPIWEINNKTALETKTKEKKLCTNDH